MKILLASVLFVCCAVPAYAVEDRPTFFNPAHFPDSSVVRSVMSHAGLSYRGDVDQRTDVMGSSPLLSDVTCRQAIARAGLEKKTVAFTVRYTSCSFVDGGTEGYSTEVCNIDCDAVLGL
jgi:hypothetical protein